MMKMKVGFGILLSLGVMVSVAVVAMATGSQTTETQLAAVTVDPVKAVTAAVFMMAAGIIIFFIRYINSKNINKKHHNAENAQEIKRMDPTYE